MCCEEGEGERERLRLDRVAQQRGRVRVVREWGVGGVEQRGREGRGRSERVEKCGDIAAERMV